MVRIESKSENFTGFLELFFGGWISAALGLRLPLGWLHQDNAAGQLLSASLKINLGSATVPATPPQLMAVLRITTLARGSAWMTQEFFVRDRSAQVGAGRGGDVARAGGCVERHPFF
jgi:hypothetical protein